MSDENKGSVSQDLLYQSIMRRKKDIFIVILGVFLGIYFQWNVVEIIIFASFIWSILGPVASRYLAIPALVFLSFVPILLSLDRKEQAEEYAIYAYYYFVMVVVRGIIELRSDKREDSN